MDYRIVEHQHGCVAAYLAWNLLYGPRFASSWPRPRDPYSLHSLLYGYILLVSGMGVEDLGWTFLKFESAPA